LRQRIVVPDADENSDDYETYKTVIVAELETDVNDEEIDLETWLYTRL
jgi:CYTH domain-containing protein